MAILIHYSLLPYHSYFFLLPNFISFDSSPLNSLPIFFLCVTISAIATSMEKILRTMEGVSKIKNSKSGKASPALIEETDTIPVIRRTIINTPKQLNVSNGCMARSTPNTVATPFPPLKPANSGNI